MPLYPPPSSTGGSSRTFVDVQYVSSDAESSVLSNNVEFVPLRKGLGDQIEFQLRVESAGTLDIKVVYSMSVANGGAVRLRVDSRIISLGGDPSVEMETGTAFSVTPGNDSNTHSLTSSDSSDLSLSVSAGDLVRVRLVRIADGNDTHTGDFRVLAITGVS